MTKTTTPTIGQILGAVGRNVSTEGFVDGVAHPEIELTIYAEMTNIDNLKAAAEQAEFEQWNLPQSENPECKTKTRIRSINDRRWILTTKTKPNTSADGVIEVECDISRDLFSALKTTGHQGYRKTRYFFPIPNTGLQWEVDVFRGMDGSLHPWVKLDLEVPSLDVELPPWPFPLRSMVVDGDNLSFQEKQLISRLWDSEWIRLDEQFIDKT